MAHSVWNICKQCRSKRRDTPGWRGREQRKYAQHPRRGLYGSAAGHKIQSARQVLDEVFAEPGREVSRRHAGQRGFSHAAMRLTFASHLAVALVDIDIWLHALQIRRSRSGALRGTSLRSKRRWWATRDGCGMQPSAQIAPTSLRVSLTLC